MTIMLLYRHSASNNFISPQAYSTWLFMMSEVGWGCHGNDSATAYTIYIGCCRVTSI